MDNPNFNKILSEALEKQKHFTNGDRIRAMNNEELADWLVMNGNGSDYQTWIDWLEQEAEEEKKRTAMHGGA